MDMLGSRRGRRATKRLAMPEIRAAMIDRRVWTGLALVVEVDGSHFEIDPDVGVLVHATLVPDGQPLMARLGGLGSGGDSGVWRIPPAGSEIAVVIPDGDLDSDVIIVGVLSSGGTPGELDGDTLVVKAPKVVIVADAAVEIGLKGLTPQDGLVHGTGIDTFTGATYFALGSTAGSVAAKK